MTDYETFIRQKLQLDGDYGFPPEYLPEFLFPFQRALVEWATMKGRAAIFADCGLGKTPMQLVWAENVRRHTGKPVLIVTPLAVSYQAEQEAAKFGIEAAVSRAGKVTAPITITNYERLHHFDQDDFGGVVCDESSAIKSFDGTRRAIVTEFMRRMPYRLLCTATAAPNDYIELGTSSEALGHLGYMDMLARFFKNDQNSSSPLNHGIRRTDSSWHYSAQWRLKGHAESEFWRWVCSWARALRRPSDMGFCDTGFDLPPLNLIHHDVETATKPPGMLMNLPAIGLREEREESRRTLAERCEATAAILADVPCAVAWCYLNDEGNMLTDLIPGAVQVAGGDSDDAKEERLMAFARGEIRVLVTKPKIAAWGLNWQHCHRMTFFPSHSYEQYYQAVRRMWRFGQKSPVTVDIVATAGGRLALENLEYKAQKADEMFAALALHVNESLGIRRSIEHTTKVEVPAWL